MENTDSWAGPRGQDLNSDGSYMGGVSTGRMLGMGDQEMS